MKYIIIIFLLLTACKTTDVDPKFTIMKKKYPKYDIEIVEAS